MTEEVSQRQGPKPFIIEPMGDELLCQYFFGKSQLDAKVDDSIDFEILDEDSEEASQHEGKPSKINRAPYFGASQVVIVREQRVKAELPEFMKSMLCLTVYESKGLEFDDVILFNFFAMGEIQSQQWKLLQGITEVETSRSYLPDWVLSIDKKELTLFIEEAVKEALAHRKERAKNQVQSEEEEEQDITEILNEDKLEQELVDRVRIAKTKEYREIKTKAAIEKFETDGTNAEFFREKYYNYCINRGNNEDQGEI